MTRKGNDYTPFSELAGALPLRRGGMYYVISNILPFAKACRKHGETFDGEQFIAMLQRRIGDEGTLLFPTFNWGFCHGEAFDIGKTPGLTGNLGNIALSMGDFGRTRHPIYSFAVWGRHKDFFVALRNKSAFDEHSPFPHLLKMDACSLALGLAPTICNSVLHYAEQKIGVFYRYEKEFTALYGDQDGISLQTYSFYVRDLNINPVYTSLENLDRVASILGISEDCIINDAPVNIVNLRGLYEIYALDILHNNARNLYTFSENR